MLNAKASLAALLAFTPLLVLHCGESSEGGDDAKGGHTHAGEGGEGAGGSSGTAGTAGTGARGGTGGSPATGGTAGRGGESGDAGAPPGGQGNGGDAGASQGGGGLGGEGGLAGGEGGIAGGGGEGGNIACEDPAGNGACTGDLSMVGTGEFEVKFTITTSTTASVAAIAQQRGICDHSYFWDARLVNGMLHFEVDDNNAHYIGCASPVALNDGLPHRVVVRRLADTLSIVVDCGGEMNCPSTTDLSTTLAPLGNQTNNPCIGSIDGTVALDGTVSDVCVRSLL